MKQKIGNYFPFSLCEDVFFLLIINRGVSQYIVILSVLLHRLEKLCVLLILSLSQLHWAIFVLPCLNRIK